MATSKVLPIASNRPGLGFTWSDLGELAVPLGVLGIVLALIVPLPSFILDLLIVFDIMLSVIVMMVAMYLKCPVEFSSFPTTLLLLTVFRLALNVSSSRLILLNGNSGTSAAGHVIEAFGNFVVGGNYVIGTVIFCVLIAIQYVVINHGAVRISEVSARFTLDALPGKQMSIDADLNAGLIDDIEARKRRQNLSREAEFYGAMDGASRFTQRDAVASILITAINIIAGFLIGVLQHGMELSRAIQTYTVLTIGDGLVTVIPALMISVSGGLIVTRGNGDERVGVVLKRQIFGAAEPLLLSSGILVLLAALPGLPTIPFLVMGAGLGTMGWKMRRKSNAAVEVSTSGTAQKPIREALEPLLRVEPATIELGLGLVSLAEGGSSAPLLEKIAAIRRQLASQVGFIFPSVKVNDNVSLRSGEYTILLKGVEVSRYELPENTQLAIPSEKNSPLPNAIATQDPAFGLSAYWVPAQGVDEARALGYTVVDPLTVMGTHLSSVLRRHAHELFSRQEAKVLCDRVAIENPRAVEDLVPKLLPLSIVQRVIQNLLRESVSVRDGSAILEALGDAAIMTRNPVLLTEYVRQSIRRTVVQPYLDRNGELTVYFIASDIEQAIERAVEHGEHNSVLSLAPEQVSDSLRRLTQQMESPRSPAVAVTSSGCRNFVRQMVEASLPEFAVLSHNEVPPGLRVRSLGVLG